MHLANFLHTVKPSNKIVKRLPGYSQPPSPHPPTYYGDCLHKFLRQLSAFLRQTVDRLPPTPHGRVQPDLRKELVPKVSDVPTLRVFQTFQQLKRGARSKGSRSSSSYNCSNASDQWDVLVLPYFGPRISLCLK